MREGSTLHPRLTSRSTKAEQWMHLAFKTENAWHIKFNL